METVLRYLAIDGTEFDTADKCFEYERSINTVRSLASELYIGDKLHPLSSILSRFVIDNENLIDYIDCNFENFVIKDVNDLTKITTALEDLGYGRLVTDMYITDIYKDKSSIIYPDILCLISTKEEKRYFNYKFLAQELQLIKRYSEKYNKVMTDIIASNIYYRDFKYII